MLPLKERRPRAAAPLPNIRMSNITMNANYMSSIHSNSIVIIIVIEERRPRAAAPVPIAARFVWLRKG